MYQRVDLGDRISVEPAAETTVSGFPEDTIVRTALASLEAPARLAGPDREAHSGRGRSRRRQLRRGDRAAARQRAARRLAGPPRSCGSWRDGSGRTCRSSCATGRSSGPVTAPRSRRSSYRRTSSFCSCCRETSSKRSTAEVYAAFDQRGGEQGYEERLELLRAALAAVRRPRDLAALPPNDLASSPLAGELLAQGAFRADVSGAGPTVYGLFHRAADADAAAPPDAAFRARLGDRACVVRLI